MGLVVLVVYIGLFLKKYKINFKVFLVICMIFLFIYVIVFKFWFYCMLFIEDVIIFEKLVIG